MALLEPGNHARTGDSAYRVGAKQSDSTLDTKFFAAPTTIDVFLTAFPLLRALLNTRNCRYLRVIRPGLPWHVDVPPGTTTKGDACSLYMKLRKPRSGQRWARYVPLSKHPACVRCEPRRRLKNWGCCKMKMVEFPLPRSFNRTCGNSSNPESCLVPATRGTEAESHHREYPLAKWSQNRQRMKKEFRNNRSAMHSCENSKVSATVRGTGPCTTPSTACWGTRSVGMNFTLTVCARHCCTGTSVIIMNTRLWNANTNFHDFFNNLKEDKEIGELKRRLLVRLKQHQEEAVGVVVVEGRYVTYGTTRHEGPQIPDYPVAT